MTKLLRNFLLPLILLVSGGIGCRYFLGEEQSQKLSVTSDYQDHSCYLSNADLRSPIIDSWHSGLSYRERSKAITEKNEEDICPSQVQKKPPRIVVALGAIHAYFLNYHYSWKVCPLQWIRSFQTSCPRYLILQVFRL